MFVSDQQATELSEPGFGSFDDPAALIAPKVSSVVVAPLLVVRAIRSDQFDATSLAVCVVDRSHRRGQRSHASASASDAFSVGERGPGRAWLPQA